jgi:Ca2+-binding RTX toxin-like protein
VTDKVDGGAGIDTVALQGNYASLTIGAHGLDNVESLALLSHTDNRFGGGGASPDSYTITTVDSNVAAGHQLIVNASLLQAGENFTFNGSAETDGSFFIYGGAGTDHLTGGAGNDIFFFQPGAWNSGDTVNGGSGINSFVLAGNYSGANAVTLGSSSLLNVQAVAFLSGSDHRFSAGGVNFSYDITTNDANVAAGQTVVFNAALLQVGETFHFNGSAETDGNMRIYGGADNDVIIGGAQSDILYGGLGADTLTGGGGNDTFLYRSVAESTPTSHDSITDFTLGDIIDLSAIDADTNTAGQQHFTFVSGGAFTHHAGELIAVDNGSGNWTISADVDGDGVADLQIMVHVTDGHQIGAGDFHV